MNPRWPSNQSPVWRIGGVAVLLGAGTLTAYFVGRRRAPMKATEDLSLFQGGQRGLKGRLTEAFGKGRLVLNYESIQGQREDLRLDGLVGRLEESSALWEVRSPTAMRKGEVWTLQGPLSLEATGEGQTRLGRGEMAVSGPALRWVQGGWEGLAPLIWTDLTGKGTWNIPKGWKRNSEGRLSAKGDIRWTPAVGGALTGIEATRVEATPGFVEGRLEGVRAAFLDGEVRADQTLIDPGWIKWPASLTFERTDGWKGRASGGGAPRPVDSAPVDRLELRDFQADRSVPDGLEKLQALEARWLPSGLRLEGSVVWEQPLQGIIAKLVTPRLIIRNTAGTELPADLAVGQARAEGGALLTWGLRSLGSPRMQVDRARRSWHLDAPVHGRGREGAFSAGAGQGDARSWTFEGPVLATLFNGGTLRGDRLHWDSERWTLTGRPVVWHRLQERLSGPRVLRTAEKLEFPDGLAGQVQASYGDLFLRAEKGESQVDRISLKGRVECEGLGWQVAADSLLVLFGPGRVVKRIQARGGVSLRGRMGEGKGEALDVDPASQQVMWQGRVRGLSEDILK